MHSDVLGTIGAEYSKDSPFGLIGVAPEATLGMCVNHSFAVLLERAKGQLRYRVFGCGGSAPFDVVLLAFQQAARDKVDIVSLSLGSTTPWEEEDPFKLVTEALEALGIIVVVANGNSGGLPGETGSRK